VNAALAALPLARRTDVLNAVCALETATGPLPATAYRALAEADLREVVTGLLAAAGRVLIPVGTRYTSGYDDQISDRLAAEGVGVLLPGDRAVLTLVLLYSVAIPRAEGKVAPEAPWTGGRPVSRDRLRGTKVPNPVIKAAIQRLLDAGIIREVGPGLVPGPQIDRLTPAMSAALFEELVLLAEPEGILADAIRRRRLARQEPPASGARLSSAPTPEKTAPKDDAS
jgi:hypothetical protein